MKNFKIGETDGFVIVPNAILKGRNLSAKALGVYFLIVSLPDDWNFSVKGLCTLCTDGKASIASAVEELENAGFLKRDGIVKCKGKFTAGDWIISDTPEAVRTVPENPTSEKRSSGNRMSENRTQQNIKQLNIKQHNIKQHSNTAEKTFRGRAEKHVRSPQNSPSYDIEAFKKQVLADDLVYVRNKKTPEESEH